MAQRTWDSVNAKDCYVVIHHLSAYKLSVAI